MALAASLRESAPRPLRADPAAQVAAEARTPRACCAAMTAAIRPRCNDDSQPPARGPVRPRRSRTPPAAFEAPEASVCVVGARRPSAYGRQLAESLGRELGAAGIVVVSGMALGVDSRAHSGRARRRRADRGGPRLRPRCALPRPDAAALRARSSSSGLVLTELPPGTRARRWTFPARNRIMAALAAMTIVVEARRALGLADHGDDGERPRPRGRGRSRARRQLHRRRRPTPAPRRRAGRSRRSGRAGLAARRRSARGRDRARAARGPALEP